MDSSFKMERDDDLTRTLQEQRAVLEDSNLKRIVEENRHNPNFHIELDNFLVMSYYRAGLLSADEVTQYLAMRSRQGYDVSKWKHLFYTSMRGEQPQLTLFEELERYRKGETL